MTLHELCEPLFQTVCRLNRSARKGLSPDFHQTQAEVNALLAELKVKAHAKPGLSEQFEKVELALIFFIDSMISESTLSFARNWDSQRLAQELNPPQLGGDERFFDLLDETLADRTTQAVERLQVFYTCLGLGFTGLYAGQPEILRRKMNEIFARMKGLSDAEMTSRICPEAYEHVNTADLVEPPGAKLVGWVIALAGMVIIVAIANFALFHSAKRELNETLSAIVQTSQGDAAPADESSPKKVDE